LDAPAEIHILGKHEVPLVKSTDGLKGASPRYKKGTTNPVNLAVAAGRTVTLRKGITTPHRGQEGVQSSEQDIGEYSNRWIGRSSTVDDRRTGNADIKIVLHIRDQSLHGVGMDLDVGIGKQEVRTVPREGHATVHATPVAGIDLSIDNYDVSTGERGCTRALRAVVDNDNPFDPLTSK
jgi:hypothetical protein